MALLTMTILSMALAATTSVMAWRVMRREARRSDARVAALASAIYGPEGPVSAGTSAAIASFASEYPADGHDRPALRLTGRRSLAVMSVAIVLVGMAGLLTLAATRRGHAVPEGATVAKIGALTQPSTQASDRPAAIPPLELIALSHERAKDSLIVRGAIRNPSNSTACEMPAVVVLTFDEHGIFLASSESAASGESLVPGGRATFSVSVPAGTAPPARYRVSFRSAGQVVPHVDRRVPGNGAGALDGPSKTERQAGAALPVPS